MDTLFGVSIATYGRFTRAWAPFILLLTLFLLSGASGLIYQVVWTRKLVLLFGTTAYAVSTVLSVFFLGLGIGSIWGGRLADRSANPLRVYGYFEILIGVWAILFVLGIDRVEILVASLLHVAATSRIGAVTLRAALTAAFLLAPVTFMGATLPLLSKVVGQAQSTRGMRIGLLYVLNTVGAMAGCLFAGLYGIELLGYTKTTFIAAVLNAGIGLLALTAARLFACAPNRETTIPLHRNNVAPRGITLAVFAFACSGFCTLALEVVWTRLLTLVFMGTTYAYTAMLASILAGIALGSFGAAAIADRVKSPLFVFGVVECAAGVACAATIILIEHLPIRVEHLQQRFALDFGGQMAALFAASISVLLLPTVLIGMSFPFAVRACTASHARLGSDVGNLYAVNTFGGVLGAIAGGYALLPWFGAHRSIEALAVVLFLIGAVLIVTSRQGAWWKSVSLAATVACAGYVVSKLPGDVSQSLNRCYLPAEHRVVAYREGIEGTVVVSEPESNHGNSNRVLWINGVQATQSITKGIRMNRFQGVLPFVFDRHPQNALLICFGSGITAGTLATSGLNVTGVELSRDVLELAHLFEEDNWHALQNPRLRMVVDDGRNFLLTHKERYDIITFEPMPLAVAGVSTFYTREFYELCRDSLTPNGIVVQWVPLHGTNIDIVRASMGTFLRVFPNCTAWFISADLFIAGSRAPMRIDFANAMRRMEEPQIAEGLRAVGIADATDFLSYFFMSAPAIERFAGAAPGITDDRPWIEFLAPRVLREPTIGESIGALIPHLESPLAIAADSSSDAALHQRLDVRFRARQLTLQGIHAIYQMGPSGEPEALLEKALDIDPTEPLAQSYLHEIAPQRVAQFLRQEDYEAAENYIEKFDRYVPHSKVVWLFRGQLYTAWNKPEKAAEAYAKLMELAGEE